LAESTANPTIRFKAPARCGFIAGITTRGSVFPDTI
jgi:hypothetical protein